MYKRQVLNLAGSALYLAGVYASPLFNIASFLAGAMMLMTGACAGVKTRTGQFSLAATALAVFSLMGGIPAKLGGALAWPCFAVPYWKQAEPDVYKRQELGGLAQVADLSSGLYADEWTDASQLRKEGFEAVSSAHVYVRLKGPYTDRDAFLEDCRAIVEGVRRTSVETPYLEVNWDGEEGYFLSLIHI